MSSFCYLKSDVDAGRVPETWNYAPAHAPKHWGFYTRAYRTDDRVPIKENNDCTIL